MRTRTLASVLLIGALACGCHSTRPPEPAAIKSTSTVAATTTTPPPSPAAIQPLPIRAVRKSQPTTPDKCPATNAPVAPANPLVTCDLVRTTVYTLGPESMRLGLTHVDPPTSLTSGFYEVSLTLDPPSAAAWAEFTAAHLHDHVAFVRDDLVLEAPTIEEPVTSGKIALTTQNAPAADQLAQLAGRPA